jgi:hypothetical protein
LAIINAELELFNLKIQYPSPFLIPKNSFPPSPLYLTDETYLIEIMELVSGMFLSKRVVTHTGVVSPLTEEHLSTSLISNWGIFIRSMKVLLSANQPK